MPFYKALVLSITFGECGSKNEAIFNEKKKQPTN